VGVAVALAAKRTTLPVVLPALLVVGVVAAPLTRRWLRPRWVWITAVAVGAVVAGALVAAIAGPDDRLASEWTGGSHVRVSADGPGPGLAAARIGDATGSGTISQPVRGEALAALRGQPFTAGVWLRLANPSDGERPAVLRFDQRVGSQTRSTSQPIAVGPEWRFARLNGTMSPDATSALFAVGTTGAAGPSILADAAVLSPGTQSGAATPGPRGRTAAWDAGETQNLLANPGFEDRPVRPRAWVRDLIGRVVGRQYDRIVTNLLRSVQAPDSWESLRRQVLEPFFETFWGRPGRTSELNLPPWWYAGQATVAAVALIGLLVGGGFAVVRRRLRHGDWVIIGALLLVVAGSAVNTLGPYLIDLYQGPPFGRYLLPALLPIAIAYVAGAAWVLPCRWRAPAVLALIAVLALLDTYALFAFLPNHFAIRPPAPG
jgi:hypothetical protein